LKTGDWNHPKKPTVGVGVGVGVGGGPWGWGGTNENPRVPTNAGWGDGDPTGIFLRSPKAH